ncbi:MAG: DUF3168 domain-containing protein [Rhizobiaceae bacterium]|nr:DUF3168 domain-containing protein [Rhizobiaceae bacterium]
MSTPDMIGALVALLKADSDVAALVSTRVFGLELPEAQAANMPRQGVIVRPSGGAGGFGGYVEATAERIDAISWGRTPYQADRLSMAVMLAFLRSRRQVRTVDSTGVLIHSIEAAGGRLATRDTETNWPAMTQAFQVTYALKAAA